MYTFLSRPSYKYEIFAQNEDLYNQLINLLTITEPYSYMRKYMGRKILVKEEKKIKAYKKETDTSIIIDKGLLEWIKISFHIDLQIPLRNGMLNDGIYNKKSEIKHDETFIELLRSQKQVAPVSLIDKWFKIFKGNPKGLTYGNDQIEAFRSLMRYPGAIGDLYTGFGKTELLLSIVDSYKDRIAILVPNNGVGDEIYIRAKKWDVEIHKNTWDSRVNIINPTGFLRSKNNNEASKYWLSKVKMIIIDECFRGNTRVLLNKNGDWDTIENIHNNNRITSVLSYNTKTKIFEEKPIRRKIKKEYDKNLPSILYSVNGIEHKLIATPNHKIYTKNRGMVRLDELKKGDVIINISDEYNNRLHYCKFCDHTSYNGRSIAQHMMFCKKGNHREKITKNLKGKTSPFSDPLVFKKAMKNRSENEEYRIYLSERMKGEQNPMKDPEAREKMRKSVIKHIHSSPEIYKKYKAQWIKAPLATKDRRKPTKPEQWIIDNFNDKLIYNGFVDNPKMFFFKDGITKIPDFIIPNQNKVIEVSDFNYWYEENYKVEITKKFKDIGIQCLYLDADKINESKEIIETFIMNHDAIVTGLCKVRGGKKTKKVYNLEIDDNHTYIADGVVVSNCHHLSAKSWDEMFQMIPDVERSLALSASPDAEHGKRLTPEHTHLTSLTSRDLKVVGLSGQVRIIKQPKVSVHLVVVNTKTVLAKEVEKTDNWIEALGLSISNKKFSLIITRILREFPDTIFYIPVHSKENGVTLYNNLTELNNKGCYWSGDELLPAPEDKKRNKLEVIKERYSTDKELKFFISTTIAFEGVDLPSLGGIIPLTGKSSRMVIQPIGRSSRGTSNIVVLIFDRGNRTQTSQSRERLKKIEEKYNITKRSVLDL